MKICIVYDSEGGYIEVLVKVIVSGVELSGEVIVYVKYVEEVDVCELFEMDVIIWGCLGYFGIISLGLKMWIDKLGYLWVEGKLIDKVGVVFCIIVIMYGGLEVMFLNLIILMFY